ncbi:peptide ABC transporter substrate-binding protein [Herpetosiphon gulosus]|uniref:Solute-binding protein family 5 domain-containing protein n=1 Tax=Herpetosiphon gulosus TaxID=1973496 RepID=A0ABP9X7I9_9CHLR
MFERSKRLAAIVLTGAILAACGSSTSTTQPTTGSNEATAVVEPGTDTGSQPSSDGIVIIGMSQSPDTLFGMESQSSATTQVLNSVQPACVTTLSYDYQSVCFAELPTFENGGAVEEMVKVDQSYTGPFVIDNELITDTSVLTGPIELPQVKVTWKLIDGITWEDGTPVTADDFLFAAELYANPGTKVASRFTIEHTAKYEKVDDQTFSWYGVPGYQDSTYFLNYAGGALGPEPKHVLGNVDAATIGGSDYASKPLAYGPYKIDEYVPQERVTLSANPNYWGAKQGLPKISNVIYKFVTSEDQILQQLQSGEIDVVGQIGLSLGQAPSLDELQAGAEFDIQYVPATVWEHIDFAVERGDGVATPFADANVRQAVAYAINRQEIIDQVLFGKTVAMNSFMPDDHWAYPSDSSVINPYVFDPNKAIQLLNEAGWVAGDDGILVKDGQPFTIEFFTTEGNATRQSVAQLVQEYLRDVGIDAELKFVPGTDALFKNGEEGILAGRRYDMALYAWVSGPEPSTPLYLCSQVPTAANGYAGQNNTGYCNPDYDKVALESQSIIERAGRLPLLSQAQQIFNRDLPTLPLYQRINVGAARKTISGFKLDPTSQQDFYNIETWELAQ